MRFVDFKPVPGREQGKDRPALVVSSQFHLDITLGELVSVLPLTSVERRGWVITEQIRTVCADRFGRCALEISLSKDEIKDVGHALVANPTSNPSLIEAH